MELKKKITSKGLGFNQTALKKLCTKDSPGPHILYGVAGQVTGIKEGQSDFGPWQAATGDFIAVWRDESGEEKQARSNVCFIPDPLMGVISGTIKAAAEDDKNAALEVAFQVTATYSATSGTGYEFGVTSMVEEKSEGIAEKLLADNKKKLLPPATKK